MTIQPQFCSAKIAFHCPAIILPLHPPSLSICPAREDVFKVTPVNDFSVSAKWRHL